MAEGRKIESWRKNGKVTAFGDCVMEIWNSCMKSAELSDRIDFVFDISASNSIKSLERQRRAAADEPIQTVITHIDQILPFASEFKCFGHLLRVKLRFNNFSYG